MAKDVTRCTIRIDTGSGDGEERTALYRRFRTEILKLGEVERVESEVVAAPRGSKSSGLDLQTLILTMAASGGVLTTLIGFIQAWLTRRAKATVTIEIGGDKLTITGASSEAERRLIDSWMNRHKS